MTSSNFLSSGLLKRSVSAFLCGVVGFLCGVSIFKVELLNSYNCKMTLRLRPTGPRRTSSAQDARMDIIFSHTAIRTSCGRVRHHIVTRIIYVRCRFSVLVLFQAPLRPRTESYHKDCGDCLRNCVYGTNHRSGRTRVCPSGKSKLKSA